MGIVFTIIIVPIILTFMQTSANEPAEDLGDQKFLVSYSKQFKFSAVALSIALMGGLAYSFFTENLKGTDLVAFVIITVVMTAACLWLILEGFFTKLTFDDMLIDSHTPWRAPRKLVWAEVKEIYFSHGMQWYVIENAKGTTIRLNRLTKGHITFVEKAESKQIKVVK